ncbi:S-adenosylmethionine-dependent methyltransferase [Kalmusia sp. IMI 367209]|nr:S-adenosylmethionine-dependent methyltransferase [Kalmusia sp. IMI 367209]
MSDLKTYVELIVPRTHVKRVKSALEGENLLEKTRKITPHTKANERDEQPCMAIPTNIPVTKDSDESPSKGLSSKTRTQVGNVLQGLGLRDIRFEIFISLYVARDESLSTNPVLNALRTALGEFPEEFLLSLGLSVDTLISVFPESYTIYRPMLLLPHNAFTSPPWAALFAANPTCNPIFRPFWKTFATTVGVKGIAVNAGIPLQTASPTTPTNHPTTTSTENILRSPSNLNPLYGNFGPLPSAQTTLSPTGDDLGHALWVRHTQNGIHQTWAPIYTMFSRGNIREKTRLLTLPSVTSAVKDPKGCSVVDLYAGIGYFAFSYKKAGVSKVLCWELNPWSIRGLERGAQLNRWKSQTFTSFPPRVGKGEVNADADFLIFAHSNEHALDVLPALQRATHIPPIRHVNCGFLPSSKDSWGIAVRSIDREMGGWIHAHENVGVRDIESRKVEVVAEMRGYLDLEERTDGQVREVTCEHVEKVKTYAPGVLHIVFDIWIGGVQNVEKEQGA